MVNIYEPTFITETQEYIVVYNTSAKMDIFAWFDGQLTPAEHLIQVQRGVAIHDGKYEVRIEDMWEID